MSDTLTIDQGRFVVKLGEYAVGPATALSDSNILNLTQDYRRQVAGRMAPLAPEDIESRIPKGQYHASRKLDGEFSTLVYQDGHAFCINPGGTVRTGLPFLQEAAQTFAAANIKSAMIAGELHVHLPKKKRSRVHDVAKVARSPKTAADLKKLRFAAFDIIQLDGQSPGESYADRFQSVESIFAKGKLATTVETQIVSTPSQIKSLVTKWVEDEDSEGVVVRSDETGSFKIKPQHTLDVVVIGFTEAVDQRAGLLHDLLVAVMRKDGSFHVLTKVGGGFTEDQRREMLSDLKDMVVESEYIEVNSDYVAYQMVKPEWVIEISCLDLISQTTRGGPVNRMAIDYKADEGYRVVRRLPLATVISPQFVRMRDDKTVEQSDIRIEQVSERVVVDMLDADARTFALPDSEVVKREVFTKVLKGQTMVRKFVLIKTNKEDSGEEFPAYVLHYTDFSPNRKDPLSREVFVSNCEAQIQSMFITLKETNIKKGWVEA